MTGHYHGRSLRVVTRGGRVHLQTHPWTVPPATTRMTSELDTFQISQIVFPDKETFVATDVDFTALFPASLPQFATIKRFSCTRCQLAQVPTVLYDLKTLSEVTLSGNAIRTLPVQLQGSSITTLDLGKNEFTEFPLEVWTIPQLQTLDFSGNRITACALPAMNPSTRAAMSGLTSLTLDDNPITAFSCRFPNLQTLSLHNTSLATLPRSLRDISKLRRLDISGNPSLALVSNETSLTLAALDELDLSSNGLASLPAGLRILVPNLKTLRLARNNLSDDENALGVLSSLPVLTTLVLDGNNVTNATAILAQFPLLTNLSLVGNGVTEVVSSPETFEALRFLNASGNAITSFNVSLPQLDTLDLSNNRLTSLPDAIFTLASLQVLDLSGNHLEPSTLSPAQFTFFSNLKKLNIDQTAFASCAVENQQALQGFIKVCVSPSDASSPSSSSSSPSTQPLNATSGGRTTTTAQILYLSGSFFLAIIIALWIFAMRRRRARAANAAASDLNSIASPSPTPIQRSSSLLRPLTDNTQTRESRTYSRSPLPYPLSNESPFWEDQELQAWRVEFDGVQPQTRLAVGVFTEVWRASYRTDVVAVKKLKANIRLLHLHHPAMVETGVLDDFICEIRVLSRLNHPRIVAFFGVAWTSESELTAIMEYLPQQDLRGFLTHRQQHQPPPRHKLGHSKGDLSSSSWSVEMVHMALCVAEALMWLHAQEPPLLHGNVQAKNVLLDDHMDAKLCDFGSAQYCSIPLLSFSDEHGLTSESDGASSSSLSIASVRADATPWIAPEVLRNHAACDPSMDIYAFGVLLAEIDTNTLPYSDGEAGALNDMEIRNRVAMGSLRPAFSSSCPLSMLALATKCLAFEPPDRPTSTDVTFALREILTEMERPSAKSLASDQARSTIGPLLNLPSTDSSVSDTDMSQRTIEFRRFGST